MAVVPTFRDLYRAAQAEIRLRNPELTDWSEGSVLDAIAGAASALSDEAIRHGIELFAGLFFDTAEGDALDALATDRLGATRKGETTALGLVVWSRGAATGAYTIPAGTAFTGPSGATVVASADVAMAATATDVLVPVDATIPGRAGNAYEFAIEEVSPALAADSTATVVNPAPIAGGAPPETDAVFRARLRDLFGALRRRGTTAALRAAALSVPGVSTATVFEDFFAGTTYVYVGDPNAQGNTALADLVDAEIEGWRRAGAHVRVLASQREDVPLAIQIVVAPGLDVPSITASIGDAIVAYGDTVPIGALAYASQIECAAHDVHAGVLSAQVLTPSARTMAPAQPQNAVRFNTSSISITAVHG